MEWFSQKQRQQFLSYHGISLNSIDLSIKELNIKPKQNNLDDKTKSYGTINQENSEQNQDNQAYSYCVMT